jgi:hypothetical protein
MKMYADMKLELYGLLTSALNAVKWLILHSGRFNRRERSKTPIGKEIGWGLEAVVRSSEIENLVSGIIL